MTTDPPAQEDNLPRYKMQHVADQLGLSPQMVRVYIKRGLFKDPRGKGRVYRFTAAEVRTMVEIWTTRG